MTLITIFNAGAEDNLQFLCWRCIRNNFASLATIMMIIRELCEGFEPNGRLFAPAQHVTVLICSIRKHCFGGAFHIASKQGPLCSKNMFINYRGPASASSGRSAPPSEGLLCRYIWNLMTGAPRLCLRKNSLSHMLMKTLTKWNLPELEEEID